MFARSYRFIILLGLAGVIAAPAFGDNAMPVSVVRIVRAPVTEELRLTGTLQARRISRLSTEVDGIVAELLVDDGDRVSAGQIIVKLNSELAEIEESATAAAVAEAVARLADAERRYRELLALSKKQHVPATNVESAKTEISITRAALAQSRARERQAQAMLERHVVSAPFSGLVRAKLVEVGEWVETSTALVELVETEFLRLEAPVPQFYFSRVREGTRVELRFDAIPQESFAATITTTIPVSDTGARTFPVRIDLPNDSGRLAPGMSARVVVHIEANDAAAALIVPQDAIVRQPDGSTTVWTVTTEDGVVEAHPRVVTTGRVSRNNIEIVTGDLAAGDQVIVRGNEILQPGQSVSVATESAMDI